MQPGGGNTGTAECDGHSGVIFLRSHREMGHIAVPNGQILGLGEGHGVVFTIRQTAVAVVFRPTAVDGDLEFIGSRRHILEGVLIDTVLAGVGHAVGTCIPQISRESARYIELAGGRIRIGLVPGSRRGGIELSIHVPELVVGGKIDGNVFRLLIVTVIKDTIDGLSLQAFQNQIIPAKVFGILRDLAAGPVAAVIIFAAVIPHIIVDGIPVVGIEIMHRDGVTAFGGARAVCGGGEMTLLCLVVGKNIDLDQPCGQHGQHHDQRQHQTEDPGKTVCCLFHAQMPPDGERDVNIHHYSL